MPINKTIYFFWGNDKMSWMRYMTLKSFRQMNPAWEMVLYRTEQRHKGKIWETNNYQDFFCYNGEDYFNKIQALDIEIRKYKNSDMTPSHASNFFKWETLANESGVYADMDILWFKPIDKFYKVIKDCDTAICQTDYVSIGLLSSSGNNNFYRELYQNAFKCFNKDYYQTAGVENIYNYFDCVDRHQDVLKQAKIKYPRMKFYNIPMNLIYPFDSKYINRAFCNDVGDIPEETIGYHWYAGKKTSQEFNNILTQDNFMNYNTLFSKIASLII